MKFKNGERFDFTENFSQLQTLRYASVAGEYFTERHIDSEYARKLGYPDIIIDGFLLQGLVLKSITRLIEKPELLQTFLIKYAAPVFLTDTIRIRFLAGKPDTRIAKLEFQALNQDDVKILDG